ncbi:MAG: glycerophosphodiester phosphodiesterase family protein [Solirubrobacterales bacterium]
MLNRLSIATFCALLVGLFATATATAGPTDRDPIPPPTDYWQDKGFILMAHQGGEWDFPPNTMYAYKKAMELGADMIDMDAYVTQDGKIVLTHDLDIYKNTESPQTEGLKISNLTLAQLKTYDFAYDWSPHDGSSEHPFRGVATDDVPPPTGFEADDFKIPTFAEVLATFPNTPINIELKQVNGVDVEDTAAEMAAILASHPGHDENVIINSFGQDMLDAMHAARPEHKSFGGSEKATLAYLKGDPITPTPVALEPPDYFNLPPWVRTVPILKPGTDHDGYQIFVWGSNHDPAQDTDPFYATLIAEGADSYNTPSPTTLAAYLCTAGIARPDGSPRCDEQICPEGQEGIAPNDCVDIPSAIRKLAFVKVKGKTKAGNKRKLTLRVSAFRGLQSSAKIRLKSSSRKVKVPKSITVKLKPGATVKRVITVRSTRKAKGKVKLTATAGKVKATTTMVYKAKRIRQ